MMSYPVSAVGFLSPVAEFLHMPINPLTVFEFFLKRHTKYETLPILPLLLNQSIQNMLAFF